jgi:hypothetical protein
MTKPAKRPLPQHCLLTKGVCALCGHCCTIAAPPNTHVKCHFPVLKSFILTATFCWVQRLSLPTICYSHFLCSAATRTLFSIHSPHPTHQHTHKVFVFCSYRHTFLSLNSWPNPTHYYTDIHTHTHTHTHTHHKPFLCSAATRTLPSAQTPLVLFCPLLAVLLLFA